MGVRRIKLHTRGGEEVSDIKTFLNWCYYCETSTLHTVDGCMECAAAESEENDE